MLRNVHKPTKKTRYYFDDWGYYWVPVRATDVRFGGKGLKAKLAKEDEEFWVKYAITFPRIWYKQKQKVSVDFDLASVGAGRPSLDARRGRLCPRLLVR